ncbi:beta family protein [Paraburkholderia bryophila]|uniref:beta family protein n=1 Tax=Paraburkholderia bryophila TaxID=420952 RepID=UPI00234ADCC6|nr:beta family protein [Paraburkholderia bryophila]WCM20431.1 beta family protein [Paraburkholderia bryophila]
MLAYVPILRARDGEFEALRHMRDRVARSVMPLLEVQKQPSIKPAKPKPPVPGAKIRKQRAPKPPKSLQDYLSEVAAKLADAHGDRPFFVDMYAFGPADRVESGEHVYTYFCGELQSRGMNFHAVVGIDRWSDAEYRAAVGRALTMNGGKALLRLEAEDLEDMADPTMFDDMLGDVMDECGLVAQSVPVLIDLGDIRGRPLMDLLPDVSAALEFLRTRGFVQVVIAGSSMPTSINEAVKKQNSAGFLRRVEMILWKALLPSTPGVRVVFGDYGVRNPRSNDNIAPDANGKIRYTIANEFFIVRGHSMAVYPNGEQMWRLADHIVASPHYAKEDFSWGDAMIKVCSEHMIKGNSTQWISYDTSHHMAAVVAEVFEYSRATTGISLLNRAY